MRIATRLAQLLNVEVSENGMTDGFDSLGDGAYPPPGYLPLDVLEIGNGDTYGFYWPISKENQPPIVCTIMHDEWALHPVASSFENALRVLNAQGAVDPSELLDVADKFGIELEEFDAPASPAQLLEIDPESPTILIEAARACRRTDLDKSATLALTAVTLLPEYGHAWELLAQVRKQQRDQRGFIEAMLRAIICPMALGGGRDNMLASIQRLPDDLAPDPADPIWQRRKELTLKTGVFESPDLRLFQEAISEYQKTGRHIQAIYLRILTGEWMASQTVSFRDRAGWSWEKYRESLRDDHKLAGLTDRLPALRN